MKIAYFDCFSGISGDMTLGALVDAGVDIEIIREALKKVDISGYRIDAQKTKRGGTSATKVDVIIDEKSSTSTTYKEIAELINRSNLSDDIKENSLKVFEKIAYAEAKVHNIDIEHVHFHEVGALDSIIDIVGSVSGISALGVNTIYSSPINTGSGFINMAHGRLPVPAPATAEILKGALSFSDGTKFELTTPTGAAIITHFAKEFTSMPEFEISAIGYGAGTYDPKESPNLLRIIIGEANAHTEGLFIIETNIDDMNPEFYDYIIEKGLEVGALDIFLTPIIMKKGRPAVKLSLLAHKEKIDILADFIFKETSSLGARIARIERMKIEREDITVLTRFGNIRVKIGKWGNEPVTVSPEYKDCKASAEKYHVPIKEVYEEAKFKAKGSR